MNYKLIKLQVVRRRALRGLSMDRQKELLLESVKRQRKIRAEKILQKEVGSLPRKLQGEALEYIRLLFWAMEESENQVKISNENYSPKIPKFLSMLQSILYQLCYLTK